MGYGLCHAMPERVRGLKQGHGSFPAGWLVGFFEDFVDFVDVDVDRMYICMYVCMYVYMYIHTSIKHTRQPRLIACFVCTMYSIREREQRLNEEPSIRTYRRVTQLLLRSLLVARLPLILDPGSTLNSCTTFPLTSCPHAFTPTRSSS